MEGDGLASNEVNYKVHAEPDWEPLEITEYFYDADVLGGLDDSACKILLFSLQLVDMCLMSSWNKELQYYILLPTNALTTDMAVSESKCL